MHFGGRSFSMPTVHWALRGLTPLALPLSFSLSFSLCAAVNAVNASRLISFAVNWPTGNWLLPPANCSTRPGKARRGCSRPGHLGVFSVAVAHLEAGSQLTSVCHSLFVIVVHKVSAMSKILFSIAYGQMGNLSKLTNSQRGVR